MAVQTAETLKGYFKTGAIPTQAQFGDLIDSIHDLIGGGDISSKLSEVYTINLIKDKLILKVGIKLADIAFALIFKNTILTATTGHVICAYICNANVSTFYLCTDPIAGSKTLTLLNATQYDTFVKEFQSLVSTGGLTKLSV